MCEVQTQPMKAQVMCFPHLCPWSSCCLKPSKPAILLMPILGQSQYTFENLFKKKKSHNELNSVLCNQNWLCKHLSSTFPCMLCSVDEPPLGTISNCSYFASCGSWFQCALLGSQSLTPPLQPFVEVCISHYLAVKEDKDKTYFELVCFLAYFFYSFPLIVFLPLTEQTSYPVL